MKLTDEQKRCPYCNETDETVRLLFIDEEENYVSQAWVFNGILHFEVVKPNFDYPVPAFNYFKNIKVNFCPVCGRRLSKWS